MAQARPGPPGGGRSLTPSRPARRRSGTATGALSDALPAPTAGPSRLEMTSTTTCGKPQVGRSDSHFLLWVADQSNQVPSMPVRICT